MRRLILKIKALNNFLKAGKSRPKDPPPPPLIYKHQNGVCFVLKQGSVPCNFSEEVCWHRSFYNLTRWGVSKRLSLPKYIITGTDVLLLCKLKDVSYPEDDHLLKLFQLILAKELKAPTCWCCGFSRRLCASSHSLAHRFHSQRAKEGIPHTCIFGSEIVYQKSVYCEREKKVLSK